MRNIYIFLILTLALSACGGAGSGGTPPPVPTGGVSGTTFDGLIVDGTVTVYDFSTGVKGKLLGQNKSDSAGLYSISLQVESRPVLVEVTGGYYTEEASSTQIALNSSHKLTALVNYVTGSQIKVAATTYTHLASGLAAYKINQGSPINSAINEANQRISNVVGFNIITTTPIQITDIKNLTLAVTPEIKYGFLAGAISMWTYINAPNGLAKHSPQYTSIDFAQILYKDIVADGLLDGFSLDSAGNKSQLSFGSIALGPDVYRHQIGVYLMKMAQSPNNKTGINSTAILAFAYNYVASADSIFNNVAPKSITPPVVAIGSPTLNGWVNKAVTINASIQYVVGLTLTEFIVDGVTVSTSNSSVATQSFVFNPAQHAQGNHIITIRATDFSGFTRDASINIAIDTIAPTSTVVTALNTFGIASDGGSGILSISTSGTTCSGDASSAYTTASTWSLPQLCNGTLVVMDKANNCSVYSASISGSVGWSLASSGSCI